MEKMEKNEEMDGMNESGGSDRMSPGGMMASIRSWHWCCCVLPVVSCLFWLAGVLFVILSWISVLNETGEVWGLGPQWWIWNAVMFGILAIYGGFKSKKFGCCRPDKGMCGDKCGDGKSGCECKGGTCSCK